MIQTRNEIMANRQMAQVSAQKENLKPGKWIRTGAKEWKFIPKNENAENVVPGSKRKFVEDVLNQTQN